MIHQGDIIVAEIPYSDFSDVKYRPCLVISNRLLNDSEDVVIVAISSAQNIHHGLKITAGDYTEGILDLQGFVHCHKIVKIKKNKISKIIISVKPQFLEQVIQKINAYLALEHRS